MRSIINELRIKGYELKESRIKNERSNLNCIDIYKDGEIITYISPSLQKELILKDDGTNYSIKEIFIEFYNLTDDEFTSKMITCSLEEYYSIKQELKGMGFIKSRLDDTDIKADEALKSQGEKLSPYVDVANLGDCWVARDINHITFEDCVVSYLYFIQKPTLELFNKAFEMVKKID